jgi:large subunit ribosomal protein L5
MADQEAQDQQEPQGKPEPAEPQAAGKRGEKKPRAKKNMAGPVPRLKERFHREVLPALQRELEIDNPMRVPRLEKIVINMGVGDAVRDAKLLDAAVADLGQITGQKPAITRARKSIANFKLREGMAIGAKVTLRGARMWEFLDRLLATALPRIRDFRGLDPDAFDGGGNYTIGVTEQLIFPEIDYDKVVKIRGMDITIVTSAWDDDEGRALLRALGFPFAGQPAVSAAAS